jgi:flavin reductase (DIM6/NTAB) family NADH-FMN oxidoreductase RutF
MKKSIGAKTFAIPSPVWVVGTYDTEGKPNVMTAAWGGICCSRPPCVYVSLREATYTYNNIIRKKAYTVNIPGVKYVKESDYFGIVSGRDTNKLLDTNLTSKRSLVVDAPYVEEFPMFLECKLKDTVNLGLHTVFVGEIIDVKIGEEFLTDGRPDMSKIDPILFSAGDRYYYKSGGKLIKAFQQKDAP